MARIKTMGMMPMVPIDNDNNSDNQSKSKKGMHLPDNLINLGTG